MLLFLEDGGRANDRKGRLFAVACCRRIWPLMRDEWSQRAVEAAEQFADGLTSPRELHRVCNAAYEALDDALVAAHEPTRPITIDSDIFAAKAAVHASQPTAWPTEVASSSANATSQRVGEGAIQADLLRDIFGPLPFRPVTLFPSVRTWNDGCVVKLATAIYLDRDFSPVRMGVLADALEEAGVTDDEVLAHLRSPGLHCRGCWLVDLLMGRE
jgi:hypothetical protein